jgi:hypothetical protein
MKRLKFRPAVLLASLMALAAFAVPATASATVWGPVGTSGSLDSYNQTVNTENGGWICGKTHLGVKVRNPASSTLDVNSATFTTCGGLGGWASCTITQTATSLPWTIQGPSTGTISITTGNVNVAFSGSGCSLKGVVASYSGTFGAGRWDAAKHEIGFTEPWTGPKLMTMGISLGIMHMTGAFTDPAKLITLS